MFKRPSAAATVVVFAKQEKKVLVIKRRTEPFKDKYAFPGGFLDVDKEDLYDTAVRELKEEAGISTTKDKLKLIDIRSDPKRDPRGHVIDVAFLYVLDKICSIPPSTEESFPEWIPLENIEKLDYAFDHIILASRAKDLIGKVKKV